MPTYLVETYMRHDDGRERHERERRARQAAAALTREGTPIRYRGLVHMPDDELCVIEFDTASSEHAELAARRAGLDPLRVVRAVSSGRGGGRQPATDCGPRTAQ